jgi:endonuclease/exonuclease/phosphatase family metal-dependent hydrolase
MMIRALPCKTSFGRASGGRSPLLALLLIAALVPVVGSCTTDASGVEPANDDGDGVKTLRLRLAAWNVENFFDRHNDPYTDDHGTPPKPADERRAIADVIEQLDADFLGLSEFENEGLLRTFRDQRLDELGYDRYWMGHRAFARGINNGGLSRLPVESIAVYRFQELTVPGRDRTWRFARDVVGFTLEPADGLEIDVLVVHFKSKADSRGDPESADWRLAEAGGLRDIVAEKLAEQPGRLIAVVGDFNDTPDSDPIQHLLGPVDGGEPILRDAHAHLPADQRVTYLNPPYRSTIDYVLVSPALYERLDRGSASVLASDLVRAGSDHAPVLADFLIPLPASAEPALPAADAAVR